MTDQEKMLEAVLRRNESLDPELEKEFDDIIRLAALICEIPVSLITLADHDRLWSHSTMWRAGEDPPLDLSACLKALNQQEGALVVEDISNDPRFHGVGDFSDGFAIRFFAGAPLKTTEGIRLGMLCILDARPRTLTKIQIETLLWLAVRVVVFLDLNLSRRRLQNTLDSIGDGLISLDKNFRVIHVNQRASTLLGSPGGAINGRVFHDAFSFTDNGKLVELLRRSLETGTAGMVEFPCERSGALLQVRSALSPEGITLLVRDITGERHREEQLRVLWACISRLNDIVLITNASPIDEPGPAIIYANDAFVNRTGYTREEVIGKSPRFLQGPATQRDALDRIRAAMETRTSSREELINYTKSGEPFWLELEIVPVSDEQDRLTHFVSVERDITDRKNLELEHQQATNRLKERLRELRALHETSRLLRDGEIESSILLEKNGSKSPWCLPLSRVDRREVGLRTSFLSKRDIPRINLDARYAI